MTTHHFQTELWLPAKREVVFAFFAEAKNLQTITPAWLDFRILTKTPVVMKPGALIDYRLKLHGWPISWRTRIALWDPPTGFMDEQLRGPYRLWQHTHTFEERDGGTLCRDSVRYAVPGGRLVDWLFVRREVKRIFSYRQEKMRRLFPVVRESDASPAGTADAFSSLSHKTVSAAEPSSRE